MQYRFALYAALNLGFLLLMGVAVAFSGVDNSRFVYLLLLFALCSTSVIDLDGLNGRYSLLGIFMLAYFVFYGVGDLTALVFGRITEATESPVTMTEAVILVGGVLLVIGYRVAIWVTQQPRPRHEAKDWQLSAAFIVGYWDLLTGGAGLSFQWIAPVALVVSLSTGVLLSLLPTRGRSRKVQALFALGAVLPLVAVFAWVRR